MVLKNNNNKIYGLTVLSCVLVNHPDTSRLAEKMAFDGIRSEKGPFGFGSALGPFLRYVYRDLYSALLRTGRTKYGSIRITLNDNFANEG